jgi:hypothetical protein
MAENEPSTERPRSRWPLILGSLMGEFPAARRRAGARLVSFLPPDRERRGAVAGASAAPAPPGPDAAQVKALEDQIDKQKAANKQIEDQIALLKERLKADVCTVKDPLGKNAPSSTPAPPGALPERRT